MNIKSKLIIGIMAISSLLLIGCNKGEISKNINNEDKKLIEVKEVSDKKYSNKVSFKEFGFEFYINDTWKKYSENGMLNILDIECPNKFPMYFKTSDDLKKNDKNDFYGKNLFLIEILDKKDENAKVSEAELSKKYAKKEKVGEVSQFEYYLWYNDNFDTTNLSEKSKKEVEEINKGFDFFKKNIKIFEPIDQDKELQALKKIEFNGKTIDGKDVDERIFKDHKITMINIWMVTKSNEPELNKIQKFYDANKDKGINVVGVILNGDEKQEKIKGILDFNSVKFTNLILDKEALDKIDKTLVRVPMKIFVDSKGNILGKAMVGDRYKEEVEKRLRIIEGK